MSLRGGCRHTRGRARRLHLRRLRVDRKLWQQLSRAVANLRARKAGGWSDRLLRWQFHMNGGLKRTSQAEDPLKASRMFM